MKITIKTLKNQQLPVECEENIKISDLKAQIEKEHTFPADKQTLICAGKKLDDDNKTLDEYNVKDGHVIIIMVAQAKPQPKPAAAAPEQKKEEPKPATTATPLVDIQSTGQTQPVQTVQPTAQPQPAQPQPSAAPVDEEKVSNLMAFTGGSREKCIAALEAANGEVNLAFEFVASGHVPQRQPRAPQGQPGAGGQPANPLQAFFANPQFAQVRQKLMTDPNFYQEFMTNMQTQQPQIYAMIQQNPMAFMQMLITGQGPQAAGGQPGMGQPRPGGGAGNQAQISVTPEEMAAIDRLVELGFSKQLAIRAFITCDRNEEMAANFLFENVGADEDEALNQAIAASTASAQQQQQQPTQQPAQPDAAQSEPKPETQSDAQPEKQEEQPKVDEQPKSEPVASEQPTNNDNQQPDNQEESGDKSAFE